MSPLETMDLRDRPGDRLRLLLEENADEKQKQQYVDEKRFTPEPESNENVR